MIGFLLTVLLAVPSSAGHVDASFLSSRIVAAPGETFDVGVKLHLRDGWHVYWSNPGDSGMATRVAWIAPKGWIVTGPDWPAPRRIVAAPLTSFGYEDLQILLYRIKVPASSGKGSARLDATIDWLECREICVPGRAKLATTVRTGEKSVIDAAGAAALTAARQSVPTDGAQSVLGAVAEDGAVRIILAGRHPGAEFFPSTAGQFENGASPAVVTASRTELLAAPGAGAPPSRVEGVLLRPGFAPVFISLPIKVGAPGLRHLLLAFLGGLLLNLMPCVFPVLSIKVLGLLSRANGRGAAAHAGAYAAGVVLSFEALAGALLIARSAGASLGWGFQLQSPFVVGMLALLFILIGLNLAGVFEVVGVGFGAAARLAAADGLLGSFLSGVFAVVVAAPCTAPFMGAALGWALVQPASTALAVFAALGLGTAAPYALLASWPALLRRLPRPGAWMETMRRALSLPMFATALWLVWVLWRLLAVSGGDVGPWKVWSPEAVQAAQAQGRTTFTDFTAAWCLTCQVNERVVFTVPEVKAALSRPDIAAFKADWTGGDPRISAELARHGRSGVPLYVVVPHGGESVVLPEILTPGLVLQALGSVSSAQGEPSK